MALSEQVKHEIILPGDTSLHVHAWRMHAPVMTPDRPRGITESRGLDLHCLAYPIAVRPDMVSRSGEWCVRNGHGADCKHQIPRAVCCDTCRPILGCQGCARLVLLNDRTVATDQRYE